MLAVVGFVWFLEERRRVGKVFGRLECLLVVVIVVVDESGDIRD
jgi:hypothetical protein